MSGQINIIKFSGEIEPFDMEKLKSSLRHSMASEKDILKIADEIHTNLRDGMTTKHIYRMAFDLLKRKRIYASGRYKLKKAIQELGPTGYPFEKFVSKILEHEGFKTEVGVIMPGHCVSHEVDVTAIRSDKHFLIECKFHSEPGRYCNVKTPLYIHSRFKDLEKQWLKDREHSAKFHSGWVYTNTRFSSDAIKYGECAGLGLVSWDYPNDNNLRWRIDRSGLHPITCLSSLKQVDKQYLLDNGIVLSKELCENPDVLESTNLNSMKKKRVLEEAKTLCNIQT